jgi:hypothetical protein
MSAARKTSAIVVATMTTSATRKSATA